MAEVVVVGAGVGGLCAAIRLAAAGHRVRVIERAEEPGGKLGTVKRDGCSFDTGPSLLTLPTLFDDVLRLAGTSLDAELDLVRLDPQFRYHWPDGSGVVVHDDPRRTADAMDALSTGAGQQYQRFLARGERIWEVSRRTFLAGPMSGPLSLARRLRAPSDLTAIDAHLTLATRARRTFTDTRLAQWAGRYATYSGSSPYAAPATLGCIAHIEASEGAWHPMGGMGRLRDALVGAAVAAGVTIELGTEVTGVEAAGGTVSAVRTSTGAEIRAGVVVADVDAQHLYRDLLPDRRLLDRVDRAPRSTSAVVLLAGVRGPTAGIGHHNVWFSGDDAAEFRQLIGDSRLADDPTIYACVSSVTDGSQAPAGDENWFVLVNAPSGAPVEPGACRDHLLATLAVRGVDLRPRLRFTEVVTPRDLAVRYRSPGGAIYGTSSNGRRAAFLRPGNRGPRRGLYLVGGSSHPGGGLPLVAIGAALVAGLVAEDGW